MTNGEGFWCPILDNPLELYRMRKSQSILKGVDLFPNFLGGPKVEKIQKVQKKAQKTEKSWKTITD